MRGMVVRTGHAYPDFSNTSNTQRLLLGYPTCCSFPKKRALTWDVPWFLRYSYVDDTAQNLAALIMQITGDKVEQPCSRCRDGGDGPFAQCVVMSRNALEGAKNEFPACGNCTYDGRDSSCECVTARMRKPQPRSVREAQQQPNDTDNVVLLQSSAQSVNTNRPQSQGAPSVSPSVAPSSRAGTPKDLSPKASTANPGSKGLVPGVEPIRTAPSGRLYDEWIGKLKGIMNMSWKFQADYFGFLQTMKDDTSRKKANFCSLTGMSWTSTTRLGHGLALLMTVRAFIFADRISGATSLESIMPPC